MQHCAQATVVQTEVNASLDMEELEGVQQSSFDSRPDWTEFYALTVEKVRTADLNQLSAYGALRATCCCDPRQQVTLKERTSGFWNNNLWSIFNNNDDHWSRWWCTSCVFIWKYISAVCFWALHFLPGAQMLAIACRDLTSFECLHTLCGESRSCDRAMLGI